MSVSEPSKIVTPWATSGLKNEIPAMSNPATGRAGFDQGFSSINMTAKEAGGIPPYGQDFNGIFFQITEILRYMQAGGRPTYSSTLSTATAGYPKGALLLGDDGVTVFENRIDGNTSNPNAGGDGWASQSDAIREALRRSYAEAGLILADGSFETSSTITGPDYVLLYEHDYSAWSWSGSFPHPVPADSTPTPVGVGGWTDRSGELLRDQLPNMPDVIAQRPSFNSLPRLLAAFADYNEETNPSINVVGLGSSVGNGASLPDPATQAPVKYLASKLKSCLDIGDVFDINAYNYSVNGSTINEWETSFDQSVSDGHTPKLLVLAYGMNDSAVDAFNSGQTYPAIARHLRNLIIQARADGSDVIVMTTPHHRCEGFVYQLNPVNPQYYPTFLAAPVAPEAMTPPASRSQITGDFTSSGVSITVAARYLRVNQMFRKIAAEFGVPVIDAEYFWFRAIEEYGEDALFNPGEVVHPNLFGHQKSYWAAIDMFIEGLQRQASQSTEAQLDGNIGVNTPSPAAVLDIEVPYTASPLPSLAVRARTGTADGLGVKASGVVWEVDPATGDLVGYGVSKADASSIEFYRVSAAVPSGDVVAPVSVTRKFYGGSISIESGGGFNISSATKMLDVPSNSAGKIKVHGYNSGIGRKYYECNFICKSGTVTLGTPNTVGDAVFTVATTGTAINFVPSAANSSANWDIEMSSGI